MPTITVTLPSEDYAFLQQFTANQETSIEEFLAHQAHNLVKQLQRPLSTEVLNATGTISSDVDGEDAYLEYIEKKYL
jgi:hypothetical protein